MQKFYENLCFPIEGGKKIFAPGNGEGRGWCTPCPPFSTALKQATRKLD